MANVILSLLMIAGGVALLLSPQEALFVVALALGFYFVAYGLHTLVYYLTMARHMTGGLTLLFIAVISIDIGSLVLAFSSKPHASIMLYLVGYNMFTGVLAIARARESKALESRWKASLARGIVNVALGVACLVFIGSDQIVTAIFCFGLFYNAGVRLARSLRPTEIIYIP